MPASKGRGDGGSPRLAQPKTAVSRGRAEGRGRSEPAEYGVRLDGPPERKTGFAIRCLEVVEAGLPAAEASGPPGTARSSAAEASGPAGTAGWPAAEASPSPGTAPSPPDCRRRGAGPCRREAGWGPGGAMVVGVRRRRRCGGRRLAAANGLRVAGGGRALLATRLRGEDPGRRCCDRQAPV